MHKRVDWSDPSPIACDSSFNQHEKGRSPCWADGVVHFTFGSSLTIPIAEQYPAGNRRNVGTGNRGCVLVYWAEARGRSNAKEPDMSFQWDYPIYLIPLPGGYASIRQKHDSNEPSLALVVYTNKELCHQFASEVGVASQPKPLKNAREFAWLLQNIRAPVTRVAFDPSADASTAKWSASIEELLNDHLVIDYSPWNYPVFVVSQLDGFASIEGKAVDGRDVMRAIALFTDQEKARDYLVGADEAGAIHALHNLKETRDFLTAMSSAANAVAVNPVVEEGKRTAKHCFSIKTVLEKYLIVQD
jgi:hypothetical protein